MKENRPKRHSREFKIAAIRRVAAGEMQSKVARDLGISPSLLATWRQRVRECGEAVLKGVGRPKGAQTQFRRSGESRVAELERLVGRQQAEIDFLERALHRIEQLRREQNADGGTASSK